MEVVSRPGKLNSNVDALSRLDDNHVIRLIKDVTIPESRRKH
jgi:hypothetical protein